MDTTRSSINKPSLHDHPLFLSAMFTLSFCDGCHLKGYMYGSYFCNEVSCSFRLHKECAEAPLEINHHPSHPEHPLLLTNESPTKDGTCDFCGQKLLSPYYSCSTCAFKVDFICGIKPSPSAIEHPVCHDHPLVFLKKRGEEKVHCELCKESIDGGPSYSCLECNNMYFHLDCVHLSKEVNHPCHPNHPVKIIASESLKDDDYAEKSCRFCSVEPTKMIYHCSVCNFTVCLGCTKLPPPLIVDHAKTHMHPLRLVLTRLGFTCKVCAVQGYGSKPYICFDCDFVIHGNCVGFPHVININRHDHRILFTCHHGRGRPKCEVCWGTIDEYCAAYICSVCPNYTVHSRCAFHYTVWNGVELEGIPEKKEDVAPFKVVGPNLIRHFSHEKHILLLLKDSVMLHNYYDWLRCVACQLPVRYGPIYSCKECRFVLHEKCAYLPRKKRLIFDPSPYTLECDNPELYIYCKLCGMLCDGFMYTSQGIKMTYHYIDVHCSSLSQPLIHNLHPHPLYFCTRECHCDLCDRYAAYKLTCGDCGGEFTLCFYCATLPEKIWYMSDEHPLTLSCDRNASGQNWCDVCESELDPSKWFYTCSECQLVLHVRCGLGDFSRLKPEKLYTFGERDYKVVLNNHYTRPFCSHCLCRCKVPVILKDNGKDNGFICSRTCLSSCLGIEFV
ncbi:uncharacterized protein LOC108860274 [Raphanus sativus]|uniref:Uncharacterized protein LOC108860274 n=1 Tax=Raphanus sativus TaxID=3726 RepID=A0A6J0NYC3_RAPSA|nr:uncharacterized protein LOC108860274 [Raphanus sativus]